MQPLALLVFMSLTAYRVTRLVVTDDFPPVLKVRERVLGPDGDKLEDTKLQWLGDLLSCDWCASFWVSGLVVGVVDVWASVPLPFLAWWAVAGLAAFFLFVEDTLTAWSHVNLKQAQAIRDEQSRTFREPSRTYSSVSGR